MTEQLRQAIVGWLRKEWGSYESPEEALADALEEVADEGQAWIRELRERVGWD